MIDTDLIPDQQKHRLLIQTDHRGQVTSAQVIDESLLFKWITDRVLPPECMEYTRTYLQWKNQVFRFLDAKTSNYGNSLGDNGESREYFTELRRLLHKRDMDTIEDFITAHALHARSYWSQRSHIKHAYQELIKHIDSIR